MYKLPIFIAALSLSACDSGPKVIEADTATEQHDHTHAAPGATAQPSNETHQVVAKEVLDTERYTYLRVSENGAEFWIAVPKTEVEVGATYYYQGGLLKQNFASREHNRVFETLYLVRGISRQPLGGAGGGSAVDQALGNLNAGGAVEPPTSVQTAEGAVKIGDLVKNKAKYAGKTVKVTGKVMKVNPMIMGRNWVHLQDGTGNNFDLTVTTQENIPPGHVATFEGTVGLDVDFGAGYRYDIILENGVLVGK